MIERTVGIVRSLVDRARSVGSPAPSPIDAPSDRKSSYDLGKIEAWPVRDATDKWFQAKFGPPEQRDPEQYAQRLVDEVDSTFQLVGIRDRNIHYSYWTLTWNAEYGAPMSMEEFRTKVEAKERRHKLLSEMGKALDVTTDKEPVIARLNGWLEENLDLEETRHILNALQKYVSLDTIHAIVRRQKRGIYEGGFGDNWHKVIALISSHYEKFRGDPLLEEYLDELTSIPEVVSAIREGKRLKVVSPPYGVALAIDEDASNPSPTIQ